MLRMRCTAKPKFVTTVRPSNTNANNENSKEDDSDDIKYDESDIQSQHSLVHANSGHVVPPLPSVITSQQYAKQNNKKIPSGGKMDKYGNWWMTNRNGKLEKNKL